MKLSLKTNQVNKGIKKAQKRNLLETNPIAAWLHNNVNYAPGCQTQIGVARKIKDHLDLIAYEYENRWLYPNYVKYCEITRLKAVSLQRFSRLLGDLCQHQLGLNGVYLQKRTKNGRSFCGLTLPTSSTNESPIDAAFGV